MNKRKRTAHRRAALWGPRAFDEQGHVDRALLDAWVPSRPMGEVVFARGVCPDDGLNMKRLFPDRWEALLNQHLDARRAGEIPGAEMLTVAPDDGTARERFQADMARAKVADVVWHESEVGTVTVTPITRAGV